MNDETQINFKFTFTIETAPPEWDKRNQHEVILNGYLRRDEYDELRDELRLMLPLPHSSYSNIHPFCYGISIREITLNFESLKVEQDKNQNASVITLVCNGEVQSVVFTLRTDGKRWGGHIQVNHWVFPRGYESYLDKAVFSITMTNKDAAALLTL